jgi:hypothetical protein
MVVLAEDPRPRLQSYPAKVRDAILARKVTRGMTREQVIMALGYPSTSYTPDMQQPLWSYPTRAGEFQIFWGADGLVDNVFGNPDVRAKVLLP